MIGWVMWNVAPLAQLTGKSLRCHLHETSEQPNQTSEDHVTLELISFGQCWDTPRYCVSQYNVLATPHEQRFIWLYGCYLHMVSHHPATFSDHNHCCSGDILSLVVEEQDSTCSYWNLPLMFISKANSMEASNMPY